MGIIFAAVDPNGFTILPTTPMGWFWSGFCLSVGWAVFGIILRSTRNITGHGE